MWALWALLVTVTMAAVDYCHANYNGAINAGRIVEAGLWSIGQWGAASVGFVVAIKVSMWYLPFEALGLFVGTLLGARRVKKVCIANEAKQNVPPAKER